MQRRIVLIMALVLWCACSKTGQDSHQPLTVGEKRTLKPATRIELAKLSYHPIYFKLSNDRQLDLRETFISFYADQSQENPLYVLKADQLEKLHIDTNCSPAMSKAIFEKNGTEGLDCSYKIDHRNIATAVVQSGDYVKEITGIVIDRSTRDSSVLAILIEL